MKRYILTKIKSKFEEHTREGEKLYTNINYILL